MNAKLFTILGAVLAGAQVAIHQLSEGPSPLLTGFTLTAVSTVITVLGIVLQRAPKAIEARIEPPKG